MPINQVPILKIHPVTCVLQHVVKFAEMTQEVQVSQPPAIKLDFGLTPGRRKANQVSFVGYSIMCLLYGWILNRVHLYKMKNVLSSDRTFSSLVFTFIILRHIIAVFTL